MSATSQRITSVLPKASRTHISIMLKLGAEKGTIDAATALAITELISDREFAVEFKTKLSEQNIADKARRLDAREARLQKAADKAGVSLEDHKAAIEAAKARKSGSASGDSSPLCSD